MRMMSRCFIVYWLVWGRLLFYKFPFTYFIPILFMFLSNTVTFQTSPSKNSPWQTPIKIGYVSLIILVISLFINIIPLINLPDSLPPTSIHHFSEPLRILTGKSIWCMLELINYNFYLNLSKSLCTKSF